MTDGKFSNCKDCERERQRKWRKENPEIRARARKREWLKNRYKLSIEEFERMQKKQNNRCYICNHEPKITRKNGEKRLQVDHCHTTKKIRKLLCHQCNRALGLLKESPELFKKCISYLKQHKSP